MAFEPRINLDGVQLELTKEKRGDFMPIWFDLLTTILYILSSAMHREQQYIHT